MVKSFNIKSKKQQKLSKKRMYLLILATIVALLTTGVILQWRFRTHPDAADLATERQNPEATTTKPESEKTPPTVAGDTT